ncbi:hypothetical protein BT67DRAFT_390895 [Trichocladium antarcticum]|uniref:Uncharacterized protein n=1 Tax=Trichocladium antarcticum TaxID=1450529 RepID=A0AAN6ZAF4_9PEZI|nr:hypothetical protein BT67DRAFT_390895 [Trichocladium antarcticum]
MGNLSKTEPLDGLRNHAYLEKQNKLREIGVDIPTSQIVVVGGQSSGKSSLLENLTGFSFPRGHGLCTRYATQITLRQSAVASVVISIIPRPDADDKTKDRLRAFRQELDDFAAEDLVDVIEEANMTMGIRPSESKDTTLPMFSDDILKVEISGPDKPHLTVIDVPGLFEVTKEGMSRFTTDLDKAQVRQMARRYMENERTIVLAVLSCISDPATEGILQLAKEADPDGVRTVGVLTKADLAREQTMMQGLAQLVNDGTLKLGYFIVRNRGGDEQDLDIGECQLKEKVLFKQPLWAELAKTGRLGVDALREELRILLTELAKRELPKQRAEVDQRLIDCRKKLEAMGAPRDDLPSQREYLIKLASQFESIVRDALDGRYEGNPVFHEKPELKLATEIIELNEGFSDLMWERGHTWEFLSKPSDSPKTADTSEYEEKSTTALDSVSALPELQQIVSCDTARLAPLEILETQIMDHIGEYYRNSRGPELGTFGGSLLAMTFRAQTSNWRTIVMAHVETVIVIVHRFIKALLRHVVVDQRMRDELWDSVLVEKLTKAYSRAKSQADSLLGIELNGRPSTYNRSFNDTLQQARLDRLTRAIRQAGDEIDDDGGNGHAGLASRLTNLVFNKSNPEQVKEDIHDILESYYKISCKRFVDVICRLVVESDLLERNGSPLKVLTPALISRMSDEQLDMIGGEEVATKRERKRLESDIKGLKAAKKVLRG